MRTDVEASRSRPPVLRRMTAGLILVAAVALVVWLAIGVIKTIVFIAAALAVVVAVLWALKTLVW